MAWDKNEPRRTWTASREDDDRPLKDFVARNCPELPAGFLNKLIRNGFVCVGDAPGNEKARLISGQRVKLYLPEGSFIVAPNPNVPFTVIYEDDSVAVVDKPAGVVSEPGIGHKLDTLLNGLVARYGESQDRLGAERDYGMVHRLDRETSGVMVVARTAQGQRKLAAQFRRHEAEKRYIALVAGRLGKDAGEVREALGRVRRGGRAVPVTGAEADLTAVTRYKVLERFPGATLVEAMPLTGRWRQIRLHFRLLGHPVAGDAEEGNPDINRTLQDAAGLGRMFLHAAGLRFRHPVKGEGMSFSLPLPAELQGVLRRLRQKA